MRLVNGSVSVSEGSGWKVKQRDSNRVDFLTYTHGLKKKLSFSVEDWDEDTEIELVVGAGVESLNWLPRDRLPSETPAERYIVPLAEARDGALRISRVKGYEDTIEIKPATKVLGNRVTYSFRDSSKAKIGDYYYFIAYEEGGAVAISSPSFVGF
tara:strand:- start:625 stop:1089 length:465 start_codon:yes stop_codon:yes gene_type:complete